MRLLRAAEVTLETQQLRCCLAALATRAAQELGLVAPLDFPPPLRRQLFELLIEWCTDSSQAVRPGQHTNSYHSPTQCASALPLFARRNRHPWRGSIATCVALLQVFPLRTSAAQQALISCCREVLMMHLLLHLSLSTYVN